MQHDLTDGEIKSLRCCPASDNHKPVEGSRTAYVRRRLKDLKLVRTLWVSDDENDEYFFTWQRTQKGDDLLKDI